MTLTNENDGLIVHGHESGVAAELRELLRHVERPRALSIRSDHRASIRVAAERVMAQLGGTSDLILTIALAGGSGVGKSTIVNALAGATIAEAAEQRPCTMRPTIYHHRDVPDGGLPNDLAAAARQVMHDRPELRFKVVVDTPDLDTFATQNRAGTRAMLKAAGLVLYVFTPEKYWDERVWSVIREEQRFSACLAILNKSDTVSQVALDRAAEEIRRRFAELGKPDIAVLRVAAARHVPSPDGKLLSVNPAMLDEFATLRAYIEHELHEGDIARMRREQRLRVVENLRAELVRALPPDVEGSLATLCQVAEQEADAASESLALGLTDTFLALETDLKPLVEVRRHRLFSGPFRVWLSLGDFLSYSVPRLVRRLRSGVSPSNDDDAILSFESIERVEQADRASASHMRDEVFRAGLPVDRFRGISGEPTADGIPALILREVRNRFDAAAATCPQRVRWVARIASAIGGLIPLALAAYALCAVLWRLGTGQPTAGMDMLGMVLSLTILAYIVLHSLTVAALVGTSPPATHSLGRQSTRSVLARRYTGWANQLRRDVEADFEAILGPLAALEALAHAPMAAIAFVPSSVNAEVATSELSPPAIVTRTSTEDVAADSVTSPDAIDLSPELGDTPAFAPAVSAASETTKSVEPRPSLRPAEIFRQAVERHAAKSAETAPSGQ